MPLSESLQHALANLPDDPGVYFFRDKDAKIIYVGKAKVLKNRVRSYFNRSVTDRKTRLLVKNIISLEWLIVRNEIEALLTEAQFVKEHNPRYNILLKDDKSFPYICIYREDFPRMELIRQKELVKDGNKYFGPYTDVKFVKETLAALQKIFPIRTCKYKLTPAVVASKRVQLCLDYHIKRCEGPCQGLVSPEQYDSMIGRIEQFIRGRNKEIQKYLQSAMQQAAEDARFEDAARYRDQLNAVKIFTKRQKKVEADFVDRDVISVAAENTYAIALVLRVRNGLIVNRGKFDLTVTPSDKNEEILSHFITRYYSATDDIPPEVIVEWDYEDRKLQEKWLREKRNGRLSILVPQKGEKQKLAALSERNAQLILGNVRLKKLRRRDIAPKNVTQLQEDLAMEIPPRRIEAFDNSNIQGQQPVASMVCFIDGKARKKEYRKFKIKTVHGANDFASMQEVVRRRYTRLLKEGSALPDLILVDGGKGQLSAAKEALDALELSHIAVIGLAKRLEEVFVPEVSEAQNISKSSPGLFLLRQIRDEAHRFAITFHRQLRQKNMTSSVLDEIPGMGKTRIAAMWKHYKTMSAMKSASAEEHVQNCKIPQKLAEQIVEKLKSQ